MFPEPLSFFFLKLKKICEVTLFVFSESEAVSGPVSLRKETDSVVNACGPACLTTERFIFFGTSENRT